MNGLPPELRELLQASGVGIAERRKIDHGTQYRLVRAGEEAVLNVYRTGRISVGGKPSGLRDLLENWRVSRGGRKAPESRTPPASPVPRVGTDEAGKGDYFGPLVVAGVRVTGAEAAAALERIGVRDSKTLSGSGVRSAAGEVVAAAGEENVRILSLSPPEYETRRAAAGSVPRLLGELHAEIINELCAGVELAVVDAFGAEALVRDLIPPGLRLEMRPRAEDDAAVAAASVLARDRFLQDLERLSEEVGFDLPRGATHVLDAARRVAETGGMEALKRVAKVHFVTTRQALENTRGDVGRSTG